MHAISYTGSVKNLLNTADMAILLTESQAGVSLGTAHFGPRKITGKPPTAWAAPIGNELVFVHELGHVMGAFHNREIMPLSLFNYNYGFQIRRTPYHTVMAYSDRNRGFTKWIPYFSGNFVRHGLSFGGGRNDNSRQLTEARLVQPESITLYIHVLTICLKSKLSLFTNFTNFLSGKVPIDSCHEKQMNYL
jgi:hypothetical protein